jgi:hypothetical protein
MRLAVAGMVGFILGWWVAEYVGDRPPNARWLPLPHSWLTRVPWP